MNKARNFNVQSAIVNGIAQQLNDRRTQREMFLSDETGYKYFVDKPANVRWGKDYKTGELQMIEKQCTYDKNRVSVLNLKSGEYYLMRKEEYKSLEKPSKEEIKAMMEQ